MDRITLASSESSQQFKFDSNYFMSQSDYISQYNLQASATQEFNNSKEKVVKLPELIPSSGIFPFSDMLGYMASDGTSYEDIESVIGDLTKEYYWFDNSVPNKDHLLQTRLVPVTTDQNNMMFSIRSPRVYGQLEFNISGINSFVTTNIEFDTYDSNFTTPFEYWISEEKIGSCDYELDIVPGFSYLSNLELSVGKPLYDNINLEIDFVFTETMPTDLEIDVSGINVSLSMPFEFLGYMDMDTILDLELEIDGYVRRAELETFISVETDRPINLETQMVWHTEALTNIEASTRFEIRPNIGIEMYPILTENLPTSLEFKVAEMSYPMNLECHFVYREDIETTLEADLSINVDKYTDIEVDMSIEIDRYTNLEYIFVYNEDFSADVEVYVHSINRDLPVTLETLIYTDYEETLGLELAIPKVYNAYSQLKLIPFGYGHNSNQVKVLAKQFSFLGLEYEIAKLSHDSNVDLETGLVIESSRYIDMETAISIEKDYITDMEVDIANINIKGTADIEYKTVFQEDVSMDIEVDPVIDRDNLLTMETLIYTYYDQGVQLETMIPEIYSAYSQVHVVPFGYGNSLGQVNLIAKQSMYLGIEYNIPELPKDAILPIETDVRINVDKLVDIEADWSIEKDYTTNVEANISSIDKEYTLPIEYRTFFNGEWSTNIEVDTKVETDRVVDVEVDTSIEIDRSINIETLVYRAVDRYANIEVDTSIEADKELAIELLIDNLWVEHNISIETFIGISESIPIDVEYVIDRMAHKLGLEIDILDLVYYYVRKGHNIVPWLYSDGKGNWDNMVDRNWDKLNTDSTGIVNGLFDQLNDKTIMLPDTVQISDSKQKTFATVIRDVVGEELAISNSFLYYENVDEEHILVLGKKGSNDSYTEELNIGVNLCIYQGSHTSGPTFMNSIYPQIENEFEYVSIWNQVTGEWTTITKSMTDVDHELYFYMEVDEVMQPMPYVMAISVTSNCSYIS